jgi:putative pyruvate formate lyase activating enzyme
MICAEIENRVQSAYAALSNCRLCPHNCGVDRLAGELGRCHAGATARVFSAQIEVGDELELIPTFAIAFSGCDMRCAFCITGADSWNPHRGEPFDASALTAKAGAARTVMILGGEPTIYVPQILELAAALPTSARLVLKTNAYLTGQARSLLAGVFDVCLADYKFGNDRCAERLAGIAGYQEPVRETLLWAADDSELIVRHLLMPGHVDCCWEPVADWLAGSLPGVKVSLRGGYWPAWMAGQHAELRGTVRPAEEQRAREVARDYGLHLIA